MYFLWHVLFAITLVSLPRYSSACNGFVFKFKELTHCLDDNVVTFKDMTVTLDKNCNFIPHGCISVKKFNTAEMHYRAEKKPLPYIQGDTDLCQLLEEKNELALLATGAMGLPQRCPVDAREVCMNGTQKVNISKYKSKLGIALGQSIVNISVTHDTGSTCFSFICEFSKPRRMG